MAFARASSIKVEIYRDMHFLSQHMFFPPLYLQFTRQTTYISPRTKKVKSNQNISNHCTKWTLGNFSCAWVIFHQLNSILHIGFCSIKCHFSENNLHVTMHYNCIVQSHWKNSCGRMQGWLGLLWALERAPDQLAAILERNIFHLLSSEETVGELLSNAL